MKTENVSARLSPETAKKFNLLAKAINRSKSYLAAEAIESYVNDRQWQIEAISEGIKEADAGAFVPDRQMRNAPAKWGIDEDQMGPPGPGRSRRGSGFYFDRQS
jgi:predicted transcriptional regulator